MIIQMTSTLEHYDAQRFLEWFSQKMLETVDPDDGFSLPVIQSSLKIEGAIDGPTLTIQVSDPSMAIFERLRAKF